MSQVVEASVIEELRLGAFKSFRGAALPLGALTLVVGRNGSGKSNALDGLWVLARLAQGGEIRDALDGGREGPAIRGGVAGCPPFGEPTFALGCSVRTGVHRVDLDVVIQALPHPQVVSERLVLDGELLFETRTPDPNSGDLRARWFGLDSTEKPSVTFRADRLLTSQVLARIPAIADGRRLHLAAAQVLDALKKVFVLDPVPHLMRQYVSKADRVLRRDAENLSAAVASLLEDPASRDVLRDALHRLNEQDVTDLVTSKSELGDVMLVVKERMAGREVEVPARIMSDGTLRFLAILTAVMQAPTIDTMPERLASEDAAGQTTIVIEELENGLHASQATMLIALVREQVQGRIVRGLATAHSPAVLDALHGDEHGNVIVCQRDGDGASTLTRLTELDDYWRIAAKGSLGKAAEEDRLRNVPQVDRPPSSFLDDLLGPAGS